MVKFVTNNHYLTLPTGIASDTSWLLASGMLSAQTSGGITWMCRSFTWNNSVCIPISIVWDLMKSHTRSGLVNKRPIWISLPTNMWLFTVPTTVVYDNGFRWNCEISADLMGVDAIYSYLFYKIIISQFNSIQFNSIQIFARARQLINYHGGARDEHRKHDPQVGDFKKKSEFSIQFWNCSARDQGHTGALEVHSRQQTMRNRILADLASWFSSGGLTEIFQVSQMIWRECAPWQACRGPTGTEVRVRGGTWTRACTVWTWCGLASRASATVDAWCLKQMRDAEAAELAWRRHGGHTVTFRAGTSDRQRGVRYSSRLGCGWGPGQASVQLPSSVNVGWCVAGVAGRNRCQPRCWRGSEASCCCRSGHRDRECTRPDGHQLHIRSL